MKRRKYAYMVVTTYGNPTLHNAQLPIYWRRDIAVREAEEYFGGADVVRIKMPTAEDAIAPSNASGR